MTDRLLRHRRTSSRLLKTAVLTAVVMMACTSGNPIAFAARSDTRDRIEAPVRHQGKPALIVVGDHAYPPYEFLKDGSPSGFNIDLIRAVAEVMGFDIRIELCPWSRARDQLETGKADVITGMYYSKERDKRVDFSVPHTLVTPALFVRRNSPIRSLGDIRGRWIIVQENDIMHDFLKNTRITTHIVAVKNPSEALQLLASGQHDGVLLSSEIQGLYFTRKLNLSSLKEIRIDLPQREYCFAVADGEMRLVNQLNEGLNIIKTTGRYKQIHDAWFGVYEKHRWWEETWKYTGVLIVFFAALVAGSFGWSWSLRRLVDLRTRELNESGQRLRTLFRESPAIVVITTPDEGRFLEVNEAFEHASGYTREEVLGRTSTELGFYADPADRRRIVEEMKRSGQARNIEVNLKNRSGRIITGLFSTTPIELKGQPCLLTIINDLTERKLAEEERDRIKVQLIQSQKMEAIGSLAGGVAHDFNNILTAIIGYTELAIDLQKKKGASDEGIVHVLQEIERSAERAAVLTKELLIFSRREKVEKENLELSKILAGMEKLLRRLIPENISLDIVLQPDITPILGHEHSIEQVIINLAANARDAMPDGGRLRIEAMNTVLDEAYVAGHPEAHSGLHAVLIVSDSGHGMDPEVAARIFEPFFTTKERGRGTGLGLSNVYGIVKQSGGHITVESRPGMGSTFKVFLPAALSGEADHSCPPAEEGDISRGSESILLCEDDDDVRQLCKDILSANGYTVTTAASGAEALELIGQNGGHIDILITDIIMPGMNGKLLAERLRAEYPGIKILFISGYTDDIINRHGISETGTDLLMKPFTRADLLGSIRRITDAAS